MNTVVVRCASCQQLSRVASDAIGLEVACPRCGMTFLAEAETNPIDPPVVRRVKAPNPVPVVRPPAREPVRPVVWELPEPTGPVVEESPPTGGMIALALLPFGIPLLWLLASALTQREVVMSFAVPVALAVGVSGLCFGMVHVNRWSHATRFRSVIALLLLAYFSAAGLFIVKKEWLQDLRQMIPRNDQGWRNYRVESTKSLIGYTVQFPIGGPIDEMAPPIAVGEWKAVGFSDPKRPGTELYLSAVGKLPGVKPWDADGVWFEAIAKAVREAAPGATAEAEHPVTLLDKVTREQFNGREFHFTKPGDVWSRVVRVYRVRGQVVYLAVEGPLITPDVADVIHFLQSLRGPYD